MVDLDTVCRRVGEGRSRIPETYPVSKLTELLCDVGEPRPSSIEILHSELVYY